MGFASLHEFRAACSAAASTRVPSRRVIVEKIANANPLFFAGRGLRVGRPNRVRQPYHEHTGVHMVVSSRMRTFVQAPFTIGRELADGRVEPMPEGADPIADQLISLFSRPNRFMTGRRMWQHTRSWLDLIGEAFWVLGRDRVTEVPRWIQPWPGGSLWQPGPIAPDGFPIGWIFRNPHTGKRTKVSADRLVFFRTINPQTTVRGSPPLLATTTRLNADVEADDRDLAFFENNAEAGGYLTYPHPLDEDRWTEIQTRHESHHKGARKQFRVGVLDDGAQFVPNTITNRDMEYLKMRQFNQKQVQGTFNWSDVFLGRGDDLAFANYIAQLRSGWENVIIPQQDIEAEDVEVQLFRFIAGGKFVGFFDQSKVAALRQAREQQWETVKKMRESGVSLKEAVRQLGIEMKPQPGWDQVFVPVTLVPVEAVIAGTATAPAAGTETATPPTSEERPPESGEEERPPTGGDTGMREEAVDAPMVALLQQVDQHTANCERRLHAGIAAIGDVEKQLAARQRRQKWLEWNLSVLRPSEREMIRRLRPYFAALAKAQVQQFDRVVRQSRSAAEAPGYTTRAIGPDDIDDILFDREVWDPRLREIMRQSMDTALDLSLAFTTQELAEVVGPQVVGLDLNNVAVQRFLDARVQLTTGINARIQGELSRTLQAGFQNNESLREIRGRVESLTDRLSDPARSLRIARTEQGTMSSTLRFQMAMPTVDFHIWLHAADENVRNTHFLAEATSVGNPVRVGSPFSNGLLHPLDPAGVVEEVVNCRCLAELVPRSQTQDRAMTADELRDAFFAGLEQVVERWASEDPMAWGGRLLHLETREPAELVPFSCNGRH